MISTRGLAVVLLAAFSAPSARAQSGNAWGVYVAPTVSHFTSGPDYDRMPSNTTFDNAVFYRRMMSTSVALRVEARLAQRTAEVLPTHVPQPAASIHLWESLLELPLIIESHSMFPMGETEGRIILGAGVRYAVLLSQDIEYPDDPATIDELGFGDYSSLAFLLDGGVSVDAGSQSIFAIFRVQWDQKLMDVPDNAIARRFFSYGLAVGLEWPL